MICPFVVEPETRRTTQTALASEGLWFECPQSCNIEGSNKGNIYQP